MRRPSASLQTALTTRRQLVALADACESRAVARLATAGAPPASQEAMDLAAMSMGADGDAVRRHLQDRANWMTLESICLDVLEPAARRLGEMWEEDVCSFTDVTIGMMRLHDGLRAITGAQRDAWRAVRRDHSILLAPAPGDPHVFGLTMVGTFFEQAGWLVSVAQPRSVSDLAAMLRREWFAVLGFSVSADRHLEGLARALPRLREASRNRSLCIMAGGPVFIANPELAAQIGADGTAGDAVGATRVAENLLSHVQSERLSNS